MGAILKAYKIREGKQAFENGFGLNENPYRIKLPLLSLAVDYWEEGWKEARVNYLEGEAEKEEKANRSIYEIPLSEFETLGDLINAIKEHSQEV